MLQRLHPGLLRLAFVALLLGVLVLSLLPPSAGSVVTIGWDKANHASAFFALGVLGMAAYPGRSAMLAAGLLGYGALVELLQGLTTWRSAEWNDLLADAVGIGGALAAVALMRRAGIKWPGQAARDRSRRAPTAPPPTA